MLADCHSSRTHEWMACAENCSPWSGFRASEASGDGSLGRWLKHDQILVVVDGARVDRKNAKQWCSHAVKILWGVIATVVVRR